METFEREAPLFDRRFHVLVQYADRDEKLLPLTVRLLRGVRQNAASGQKERVLRVEVTDDDGVDPFFLFLWSVSEEEFHELKAQQRLLVDFASFPANLIELLECCLKDSKWLPEREDADAGAKSAPASDGEGEEDADKSAQDARAEAHAQMKRSQGPTPLSYLAVLNTCNREGQSVFSIVETNQFKHLTHLSLQFFPGDDAAVKTYLAARLAQVNAEKRSLSLRLRQTTADRDERARNEADLQKQLDTLQQQTDAFLSQEKLRYADDLSLQRNEASAILKKREDELNAKIDALTQKFEAELKALKEKSDKNEALVQTLSKEKYQHELLIDQLRVQSKDLGENKSILARELEALRSENKQLDQKAFEQEKQINMLQMRANGLQQQLADKEEVIAKTTEMLQAAQGHNQEVEESLKMYRDNHARLQQKLELSISEINKGNEIIERIQNESRALKSKIKMKTKIIKQQEQVVKEKQLQREELMLQLKTTRDDLCKRDDHIDSLKTTIKDLSQKLEDSNKLLASNQQVIAWLNKEINEAQLAHHRRAGAHPSVLSFRPSDKKFSGADARPTSQFTSQ